MVEAQLAAAANKTISSVAANLNSVGGGSSVNVQAKNSGTLYQPTMSAGTVSYAYQSATRPPQLGPRTTAPTPTR